jgi:uncharacterized protein YraI
MAALVGVSAAAATATLVAVAGPAMAAPSNQLTSCTEQVRVRSQPEPNAPVIGSCAPGEQVTAGETRNGFTHLVNKKGWASTDYVKSANEDDDEDTTSSTRPSSSAGSSRPSGSTRPSGSSARSGSNSSDKDDDSDDSLLGGL